MTSETGVNAAAAEHDFDESTGGTMRAMQALTAGLLLAFCGMLSGCGGLSGQVQPALFDLPKSKKVLIFVDVRPTVLTPAGYASNLADKIGEQLYVYHALDHTVSQNRLLDLERDSDKFSRMHVADIARATGADVVVDVDLYAFTAGSPQDEAVTQGYAQALVKVIDSNGKRLWPTNQETGLEVDSHVDPDFTEHRDKQQTVDAITVILARDVGRIFHAYNTNESTMPQ